MDHKTQHFASLDCTVIYFTAFHCAVMHFCRTVLNSTPLYCRPLLHFSPHHFTTLHNTRQKSTSLHFTACTCIELNYTVQCPTLHCTSMHALFFTPLHCDATSLHPELNSTLPSTAPCTSQHCTSLHPATLHFATLHCTKIQSIALHCTVLHQH